MGQGSAAAAELSLVNTEFWLHYAEFESLWAELEREDSEYSDNDE